MTTSRSAAAPSPVSRPTTWFLVLLTTLLLGAASTASAIQIYVELPIGEEGLGFEVEPSDLVLAVKQQIQDGENSQYFAVSEQVLVFDGEVLEDDQTFAFYNIVDESVLELRLPKLQAEMNRIFAQAGRLPAQLKKFERLLAEIKRFDRRTSASFRALNRARTPVAFNRAKARLRPQYRRIDSAMGGFLKSVRQMNALFGSIAALNRELGGEFDELNEMIRELRMANAELTKLRRGLRRDFARINRLKFPK